MSTRPTLDLTMADLIDRWPDAIPVIARHGMACVGCGMAKFETISEAAVAYGVDPQAFLRAIARGSGPAGGRPRRRAPRRHGVR